MNFVHLGLLADACWGCHSSETILSPASHSELPQQWAGHGGSCVQHLLLPFSLHKSLLNASWACLYVAKVAKMHFSPQAIPSSLCGCSSLEKRKLLVLEKLMTLIFIPK